MILLVALNGIILYLLAFTVLNKLKQIREEQEKLQSRVTIINQQMTKALKYLEKKDTV
ncbi:hypothetical protein ACR6HW_02135 [Fusibacter sp. JL298sf-3]